MELRRHRARCPTCPESGRELRAAERLGAVGHARVQRPEDDRRGPPRARKGPSDVDEERLWNLM